MEQHAGRVLAVVTDLFFKAKINEAARAVSAEVTYARNREEALRAARASLPSLIVVDLNAGPADPLNLITDLKSDDRTRPVLLIGFVAHVDTELQGEARKRGCERVLARSAFFRGLGALLVEVGQRGGVEK
jgi:PleD family two-component response regulator